MKQTLLAVVLAVTAVSAQAEDAKNFVHGQYTFRDTIAGQSDNPNRQGVNLTVGRNIGYGITLDANTQFRSENGSGGNDTTRLETGATFQLPVTNDISLYTRGAIGYKFVDGQETNTVTVKSGHGHHARTTTYNVVGEDNDDFTYYSVEPGVKLQLTSALNVRAGYRYRTAFNDSINDKTNTVRVGAEYALDKTQSVTLGVDRAYGDSEFIGVNVGYAVKF